MTFETGSRRQFLKMAGCTAAVGLAAPAIAQSGPVTLTMSSWLPPGSPIRRDVFETWGESVGSLTGGRVQVEIPDKPFGPPPAHLPLIQENKVDLSYALHGYSGDGAFLRARVGQFSFLGDAYRASHAFSGVYTQDLDAEKEHEGIQLLGVFQHGPGVLLLRDKRIDSPADFAGLRIRTPGGYVTRLLESVDAVPVQMSPFDIRAKLEAGEIDGCCLPYEGAAVFNLMDLVSFILEIEGGFYNASWFLGMSNQAWGRLPEADGQAILEMSRREVHVLAAKAFDIVDYTIKQRFVQQGVPISFVASGSPMYQFIQQKASVYEQEWKLAVAQQDYDGDAALSAVRASRLKSEETNVFSSDIKD